MISPGIKAVQLQQAMSYVQVVSVTVLVYDWLLLLSAEVEHIWKTRWTFVKILYLWTRYAPVADTVLGLLTHFTFLGPQACKLNDSVNSFLVAAGIYSSELVLVWRTLALWQDSKRVRYGLCIVWALMFPMGVYSITAFVISTVYGVQPFPDQPGCNLVGASPVIAGNFIGLAVLEIVIVVLTAVKGFYHMRNIPRLSSVQYVRTLYRDGVLFFVCLALLSVGNILAPFLGPKSNALLLPTFLRIMHSTLCCRVILNLRRAAAVEQYEKEVQLPQNIKDGIGGPHTPGKISALRFHALRTLQTLTTGDDDSRYIRMESPLAENFGMQNETREVGTAHCIGGGCEIGLEDQTVVEGEKMV